MKSTIIHTEAVSCSRCGRHIVMEVIITSSFKDTYHILADAKCGECNHGCFEEFTFKMSDNGGWRP